MNTNTSCPAEASSHSRSAFWIIEGFIRNAWQVAGVEDSFQRACYLASILSGRKAQLEDRVRIITPEGAIL